jgi:integrase
VSLTKIINTPPCVGHRPYIRIYSCIVTHITLQKHPWRPLKTAASQRDIPLMGSALRASERTLDQGNRFAFPRYCSELKCNANSASAALNKWLKHRLPEGCVIHSFRHSLRDRLRTVECPSDIIDAIGGWDYCGSRP